MTGPEGLSLVDQTGRVARSTHRAWVVWNPLDRTYAGYVASLTGDGREVAKVADAPDGIPFEQVIGWATQMAAEVFVRPHWDPSTTYWAGDGVHDAHPLLDRDRAGEPVEVVDDGPVTISGVIANCADCDWHGTFPNHAELLTAYAAHAHDHGSGSGHS